jgi:hypothetical protein
MKPFSMRGEAVLKLARATTDASTEDTSMLAEKFFLLLETLKSRSYPDGGPRVISTAPHVPIKLPAVR